MADCDTCRGAFEGPVRRGKCSRCYQRARYAENIQREREKVYKRAWYLKRQYGLTLDEYDEILETQNGVCAICGTDDPGSSKRRFTVDHDHACCSGARSCGECVRGLLCNHCNVGLAQFRDNTEFLMSAATYLGGGSHRR